MFASRAAAKNGARLITNEPQLLERCNAWTPPAACVAGGVPTRCVIRTFGKKGFRRDVKAVQDVDILVGTHGAALVHAVFMRRGAALIEVRPYGFSGKWPDQYHRSMARAQNEVRVMDLSPRHPSLTFTWLGSRHRRTRSSCRPPIARSARRCPQRMFRLGTLGLSIHTSCLVLLSERWGWRRARVAGIVTTVTYRPPTKPSMPPIRRAWRRHATTERFKAWSSIMADAEVASSYVLPAQPPLPRDAGQRGL